MLTRTAGERPARRYAGPVKFAPARVRELAGDPAHRRLHLRGRRPLGRRGSAGPPCCPSPTSSWSPRPAAGPCSCPRRARAPGGPGAGADEVDRRARRPRAHRRGRRRPAAPTARSPMPEVAGVDPNRDASERALLAAALAGRPAGARHLPRLPGPQRRARRHAAPAPARRGGAPRPPQRALSSSATSTSRRCRAPSPPASSGPRPRCAARTTRPSATSAAAWWPPPRTADGVVEAVELPSARFVLGVQWHPEEGMDQRPFDALVEAARRLRGRAVGAPERMTQRADP